MIVAGSPDRRNASFVKMVRTREKGSLKTWGGLPWRNKGEFHFLTFLMQASDPQLPAARENQ
jgi:hypothetical protein